MKISADGPRASRKPGKPAVISVELLNRPTSQKPAPAVYLQPAAVARVPERACISPLEDCRMPFYPTPALEQIPDKPTTTPFFPAFPPLFSPSTLTDAETSDFPIYVDLSLGHPTSLDLRRSHLPHPVSYYISQSRQHANDFLPGIDPVAPQATPVDSQWRAIG